MGNSPHLKQPAIIKTVLITICILIVGWTILCGYLYLQTNSIAYKAEINTATKVAEDNINKDFLYRRWGASHGGVYVPITKDNPPNPYLKDLVFERDIQTPSGRKLTLVNPAYMVRQVHEIGSTQYGLKAHITSLKPLRPLNIPDKWEAAVLKSFEIYPKRVVALDSIEGEQYLRVMEPLITEKSCIKCHASQGYEIGDIRGGLSVSVPWKPHAESLDEQAKAHAYEFGGLWFLGMIFLIVSFVFIRKSALSKAETDRIILTSQKKYYDLVESTPDLITIVDAEGRIVFVNHSAVTIFGLPPEECIGKMAFDFIHPEDRQGTMNAFDTWLKSGEEKFRFENRQIGVNNQEHLLTWVIIAERDDTNSVTGFVSTGRDITEYNAMADQLRHNEKMQAIGQLAGGVAHDFNNQLGGILNFAELAKNHMDKDSKTYTYMKKIISGVLHSAELTNQLLAFARKGKYVVRIVDVNAIINEVTSILTHSIDKKIKLLADLNSNPMTVSGDASQLQNAILNIALNARDAMSDGGLLSFSTKVVSVDEEYIQENNHTIKPDEYLQITIKDTGEGMKDEIQKRMFEPFFTTKEIGKGTGMGMASVYGTILNHSGAIEVDSTVGEGTTVTILLPFIAGTKEEQDSVIEQSSKSDSQILVVDDEEMLAMSMKMLLADEGYEAIGCGSGKEAIQIFAESWKDIDLVLLDVIMPDLNGLETYRALKEINPDVNVIVLSGYSITEGAKEIIDEGALGFLQKPVLSKDLFKKITEVLS